MYRNSPPESGIKFQTLGNINLININYLENCNEKLLTIYLNVIWH